MAGVTTRAYTDGACRGNPGPGGWAYVADSGPWASGSEPRTTNQRMEIMAAFRAVSDIAGPLEVVSDSTYVVKCFNDRWWAGWLRRGWKNSQGKPVANRDLWEPFVELVRARGDVTFTWVKGHSGDPLNEAADLLATLAADEQQGRRGDCFDASILAELEAEAAGANDRARNRRVADSPPAGSGGPLREGPGPAAPAPSISGPVSDGRLDFADEDSGEARLVVATGLRPTELGGWQENPTAARVRSKLAEIFSAKQLMYPHLTVATGLGLGAELLAAEAARSVGVPYIAVLPFPGVDKRWPEASRQRFRRLRSGAREVVLVGSEEPRTKEQFAKAMRKRDDWLGRHGDEAVVVWDGRDPGVARAVKRFEKAFGEDLWILEP